MINDHSSRCCADVMCSFGLVKPRSCARRAHVSGCGALIRPGGVLGGGAVEPPLTGRGGAGRELRDVEVGRGKCESVFFSSAN